MVKLLPSLPTPERLPSAPSRNVKTLAASATVQPPKDAHDPRSSTPESLAPQVTTRTAKREMQMPALEGLSFNNCRAICNHLSQPTTHVPEPLRQIEHERRRLVSAAAQVYRPPRLLHQTSCHSHSQECPRMPRCRCSSVMLQSFSPKSASSSHAIPRPRPGYPTLDRTINWMVGLVPSIAPVTFCYRYYI